MKISIIGGDARQTRLHGLLLADGFDVASYGLGFPGEEHLGDCLENSACVVLPVPALRDDGAIHMPLSEKRILAEEVFDSLPERQLVTAGRVTPFLYGLAERKGVMLVDYARREEFTVMNAAPTVEGALALAMERTAMTLHGASCLVIGFGRIGKLLAHRLHGLGAKVTVSARKPADFAWMRVYGYEKADTRKLDGYLAGFQVVFNTVPTLVLNGSRLKELPPGCVVIDLASTPGGVDFEAARHLGVTCLWALSLPGKVAPATAAQIVRDTVYHIMEENGVGNWN